MYLLLLLACSPDKAADTTADRGVHTGTLDSGPPTGDGGSVADDTEAPPMDTGPRSYRCDAVGTASPDGFFSVRAFNGVMYAGEFGYGLESRSVLYRYPDWERVSPGITGVSESVCAMRVFEGQLYANTESSGDIYRSADGESWSRVYDGGDHTIGCALEVFDGRLYAVNYDNRDRESGRVLRSGDGGSWETVWDSGAQAMYLRELVAHDGALYAYAVDEDSSQGWQLRSTDGASWSLSETPSRFFRALSWGGELYIGSADRSSSGPAGIWRSDGSAHEQVYSASKHYVTELADWDGALWAGTSDGWKDDEGTSALLRSADGASWETICEFSELAIWGVAALDDALFAATWQYGDGGTVYRITVDDAADPGTDPGTEPGGVDCGAIPAADPDWELCVATETTCEGVYADGAGCDAYCAAAGLRCTSRYGGEPGCQKEADYPIACGEVNDHQSDWCECG